jgi:hypothetical protein
MVRNSKSNEVSIDVDDSMLLKMADMETGVVVLLDPEEKKLEDRWRGPVEASLESPKPHSDSKKN